MAKLNGSCHMLTICGLRLKGVQCNLIEPVGHWKKRETGFESQESAVVGWICEILSVVVSADWWL